MRLIDADKFIEKLKEHKSLFCKNRVEFIALSDKDKARVDEIDTCIAELVNAEEVPHAQLGTNLAEVGVDVHEIVRCKDCKLNPKYEWFGCPMSHLSEKQRPETAWCWKAERRTDERSD